MIVNNTRKSRLLQQCRLTYFSCLIAYFCRMYKYLLLISAVLTIQCKAQGDDDRQKAIDAIFTTPNTDFLTEYEEVTSPRSTDFGVTDKCGEGKDLGKHKCVRYFNCDSETNTIIPSTEYDGTGLIDIRYEFFKFALLGTSSVT